jgi:glycerophosphoryl diester phosphodiesterase
MKSKNVMHIILGVQICLTLIFGSLWAFGQTKPHVVKVSNFRELQRYFTYKKKAPVIISGHRGGMMKGYPENSIESCEKTLSLMPSFFEIDPRLTKDSVLVLMHDATINRTTNGKGKVADFTYAELQKFTLKDREGNVTSYRIPTLVEMLDWGKDKTIFNLDNKGVPWEMYSKLLKEKKYPNIMLSVRSLKEALFYFERNDDIILCVSIKDMEEYNSYKNSGIPWNRIMAYVGYTMDPAQQQVYDLLHAHGVMCMIAVGPTKDKIKNLEEKQVAYKEEIARKPDIIETDYPSLFSGLPLKK